MSRLPAKLFWLPSYVLAHILFLNSWKTSYMIRKNKLEKQPNTFFLSVLQTRTINLPAEKHKIKIYVHCKTTKMVKFWVKSILTFESLGTCSLEDFVLFNFRLRCFYVYPYFHPCTWLCCVSVSSTSRKNCYEFCYCGEELKTTEQI